MPLFLRGKPHSYWIYFVTPAYAWRASEGSGYDVLEIGSFSYLDEFWCEVVASQNVDCLEIEFDTESPGQQQDGPARWAGGQVVQVHRHYRLCIAGSAHHSNQHYIEHNATDFCAGEFPVLLNCVKRHQLWNVITDTRKYALDNILGMRIKGGHTVAQRFRQCARSRKVAGSRPDKVNDL
jgi:hypothetical protein